MERLQKILANAGVASRRASEELISSGRVRVNGEVVTAPGTKVDPSRAVITVDDRPISTDPKKVYLALNKPRGYISTAEDTHGRKTVLDLVPYGLRLYPVGRLDADSEGLILLTNDGEWTNYVIHPRYEKEKEYHVLVFGRPTAANLTALRQGIRLEEGMTSPAKVGIIKEVDGKTWLSFVIHEGRKRQIRRMLASQGLQVAALKRVRIGSVSLGNLRPGQTRRLTDKEVKSFLPKEDHTWPDIITIDGPAGVGKSTVGEILAKRLGYLYFDTGAMYRALALAAVKSGTDSKDEAGLEKLAKTVKIQIVKPETKDGRQYTVLLDGRDVTWDIRSAPVDAMVSDVSVWPGVRRLMVEQQRAVCKCGHVVMVGRDAGTAISPDADLKIFLVATPETRAKRRYDELVARGQHHEYRKVLEQVQRRDKIDSGRAVAPLKPAKDAHIVDTEDKSVAEVVQTIEEYIKQGAFAKDTEE